MVMTPTELTKLEAMHDDIRSIKQLLKGYNGQTGLIEDLEVLKKDYREFKVRILVVLAAAGGGGGAVGAAISKIIGG